MAIARQPDTGYKQLIPEIERSLAQMALTQRRFPEAQARAQSSLSLAGMQYKNVAIEAKFTLGLAKASTASTAEAKKLCLEAVNLAKEGGDSALLSRAMLALAETMLETDDARTALELATQAQARFATAGQQESEWRAWLIAARASQLLGDKTNAPEQLANGKKVYAQLQQNWGTEVFNRYLTRPDIQVYYKQLG